MVVQPAGAHQLGHEGIDAGQAGAALRQIGRQGGAVGAGGMAGAEGFAVVPDAVTELAPEPLPVIAPAELLQELARHPLRLGPPLRRPVAVPLQPAEGGLPHLRQAEHPWRR